MQEDDKEVAAVRDPSHIDFIERWAQRVRKDPSWKAIHTEFIDAQFRNAERVIQTLASQPGGAEKIVKLYRIKNRKGYEGLLGGDMRE